MKERNDNDFNVYRREKERFRVLVHFVSCFILHFVAFYHSLNYFEDVKNFFRFLILGASLDFSLLFLSVLSFYGVFKWLKKLKFGDNFIPFILNLIVDIGIGIVVQLKKGNCIITSWYFLGHISRVSLCVNDNTYFWILELLAFFLFLFFRWGYYEQSEYSPLHSILHYYTFFIISVLILFYSFHSKFVKKYLKDLQKQSENSADIQSKFIAKFLHDIRNGVNCVSNLKDHLRTFYCKDETLAEPYKSTFDVLEFSNDQINYYSSCLYNCYLRYVKNEKKKFGNSFKKKKKVVDVHEFFKIIIEIQKRIREKREVEIILDISKFVPKFLLLDKFRLSAIFHNIISNSLKFTTKGEIKIKVRYFKFEKKFVFKCTDTGCGIPEEKLNDLFIPFNKVNKNYKVDSLGLGMSITKELVDSINGTIEIQSVVNLGTKVKVWYCDKEFEKIIEEEDYKLISPKRKRGEKFGDLFPLKILCVDDTKICLMVLRNMFKTLGMKRVFYVDSGEKAVILVKKHRDDQFDLILMDIDMPSMNGFECTKKIKGCISTKSVFICACTGKVLEKEECLNHKMFDVIIKPFKVPDLVRVLRKVHYKKKSLSQRKEKSKFFSIGVNRRNSLTPSSSELNKTRKQSKKVAAVPDSEKRNRIFEYSYKYFSIVRILVISLFALFSFLFTSNCSLNFYLFFVGLFLEFILLDLLFPTFRTKFKYETLFWVIEILVRSIFTVFFHVYFGTSSLFKDTFIIHCCKSLFGIKNFCLKISSVVFYSICYVYCESYPTAVPDEIQNVVVFYREFLVVNILYNISFEFYRLRMQNSKSIIKEIKKTRKIRNFNSIIVAKITQSCLSCLFFFSEDLKYNGEGKKEFQKNLECMLISIKGMKESVSETVEYFSVRNGKRIVVLNSFSLPRFLNLIVENQKPDININLRNKSDFDDCRDFLVSDESILKKIFSYIFTSMKGLLGVSLNVDIFVEFGKKNIRFRVLLDKFLKNKDVKIILNPFSSKLAFSGGRTSSSLGILLSKMLVETVLKGNFYILTDKEKELTEINFDFQCSMCKIKNKKVKSIKGEKMNTLDTSILIVDDNLVIQMALKRCLRKLGFCEENVDQASTGVQAVDLLKKKHFDVIFLDYMLPNFNGIQVIKNVVETDKNILMKSFVFFCSGTESDLDFKFSEISGHCNVAGKIEKPVRYEELQEKLKRIVNC